MKAFWTLHSNLPREGPGDAAMLDRALRAARVAETAQILDAGAGPGADIAALLTHVPRGHVTAIEQHADFARAAAARFAGNPQVTVKTGDMADPGGAYELIWCAGALYFLGVEAGLRAWRTALRPGGQVIFSDAIWLTAARPDEAVRNWQEYPAMTDRAGVARAIAAAGYTLLDDWVLPDAAWEAYYTPLEARVEMLTPQAETDPDLAATLAEARSEIALWRRHRRVFGYGLFRVRLQ